MVHPEICTRENDSLNLYLMDAFLIHAIAQKCKIQKGEI